MEDKDVRLPADYEANRQKFFANKETKMKDKAEKIDCPKCLEGYMVKIEGLQQCNQRCGNTLLPAAYEANRQKFLAAKKRRRTNNKKRSQFCCRCATKHMLDRSCEIEEILYLFYNCSIRTIIR